MQKCKNKQRTVGEAMAKYNAFLFPGQGAQTPGMLKDIAESIPCVDSFLQRASDIAQKDMKKLLWDTDQTTLSRSDNSQLAITVVSLALVEALKEKGIMPTATMGFSLGEFPALAVAGVLSIEEVIKVVLARGSIMQKVCEEIAQNSQGKSPGMTAVIGLSPDIVLKTIEGMKDVYAANMNSTKQTVISGTYSALETAEAILKEKGARRAIRLAVAGPFHCPLMQKAADEFEAFLKDIEFKDPQLICFSNVTGGQITKGSEAKKNAVLHLTHPVLWTTQEAELAKKIGQAGKENWSVLEVGPGKVLSGLWRDTTLGTELASTPCNTLDVITSL